MKVEDLEARRIILDAGTPGKSKRLASLKGMADLSSQFGREVKLRPDWEEVKVKVMIQFVTMKFHDPTMRNLLKNTGTATLIEGNSWHDCYWDICRCTGCGNIGQNRLGLILMSLRSKL